MTNLVIQVFSSSSEIKIAASKMILKTSLLNISINLHVICRNKVSMRRSIKAIPRKNVIEHFENQVEISRLKKSGFAQKGMGCNGQMQGYRWCNTLAVKMMYVV